MLLKNSLRLSLSLVIASCFVSAPAQVAADTVTLEQFATDKFPHRLYGESTYYLDYSETYSSLSLEMDEANGSATLYGSNTAIVKDAVDGNVIGTAYSTLELLFLGLDYDATFSEREVVAVGIQGEASSEGTLSFDITLDSGAEASQEMSVRSGFFDPFKNGTNNRIWGFVGSPFNFLLSKQGDSFFFDSWVNSYGNKYALNDEYLKFQGDIHLRGEPIIGEAEVPEPSTILLLGLGALGLAYRQKSANA